MGKKWEYKVIEAIPKMSEVDLPSHLIKELNALGEERWELVGVVTANTFTASNSLVFFLKKEIFS